MTNFKKEILIPLTEYLEHYGFLNSGAILYKDGNKNPTQHGYILGFTITIYDIVNGTINANNIIHQTNGSRICDSNKHIAKTSNIRINDLYVKVNAIIDMV